VETRGWWLTTRRWREGRGDIKPFFHKPTARSPRKTPHGYRRRQQEDMVVSGEAAFQSLDRNQHPLFLLQLSWSLQGKRLAGNVGNWRARII
jgi:hypothetical protein